VTVLRPGNFLGVRPGIEPRTSRSGEVDLSPTL